MTKYILCEYDVRHIDDDYFENFDNYLLSLITRDYIPVIAHVERYYQRDNLDLEFVQYLIDMGCIIQINSSSLLHEGPFKNNAIQLSDHQLVHVIASDTHQAKGVRYPNLDECYHQLMKMGFDKQYLKLLFHENPQRIIEDKYIIQPHFKKRSFIQKVLKNK